MYVIKELLRIEALRRKNVQYPENYLLPKLSCKTMLKGSKKNGRL